MSHGGTLFYEYHRSFSAKAVFYIQKLNQRLDLSVGDLNLISRHFTGPQTTKPPLYSVWILFSHSKSLSKNCDPAWPAFASVSENGREEHRQAIVETASLATLS